MPRITALRILFDKNVPVGVREFLSGHEVTTFVDTGWDPRLENGKLLNAGEAANFEVFVTWDQNIKYQQNLTGRKLALVVLGSNIWPVVREHGRLIRAMVDGATPGSYQLIEMTLPLRVRRRGLT